MKFLFRAILLLGSLVWLVVCAKQFVGLGILDNPAVAIDNPTLLIQIFIALMIFRSAWMFGQMKRRRF
ncbi:hypothetical protein HWQ46_14040 [Shewanella sp. D64]|uniref:hypothetical protein n=1 Tax=unclassified Shewanella TaxID=196818 RepID=UPI0022BA23A7|nr:MULTISPECIES: hypothetical protein [unclassified Shewanella]MEC4726670.1 hypothetical protein [Shewanella sp. D64]MEC4738966.1 hypothetical protein [Shewanella sp. E94]WBJ96885.1 hypothetical protein HWQ47_07145 [Shewanella sp. MTB7]